MRGINSKNFKIFVGIILFLVGIIIIGILVVTANPDYISDTFTNESKIGKGTQRIQISTSTGEAKLAECYYPNPEWNKVADTVVRDINSTSSSATTSKDLYCDNYNCVFMTDGVTPSVPLCVATDPDVYGNILWSKTDSGSSVAWATSNFSIAGGDQGGMHPSGLTVGANAYNVGLKYWLERYYTSPSGTFPAMDLCKAKGSGWRLPNILELDSIRDMTKGSAPYTYLPNMMTGGYWSSTQTDISNAYGLYFSTGNAFYGAKTGGYHVRCVRDF